MIELRKAAERGHADHGWLNTYHTFSFAGYYNPQHMGFRVLRVINEDRVKAGNGFGSHPHHNMEILSYVLSGELEHKDSMGNGSVIRPGEFQLMSAGSGVTHSEFNPSKETDCHFYQIWILPDQKGLTPTYQQRAFTDSNDGHSLRIIASKHGSENALTIHQDINIYLGSLPEKGEVTLPLHEDRYGWIQLLHGEVQLGNLLLNTSDGAAISEETDLTLTASADSEFLFFDLP